MSINEVNAKEVHKIASSFDPEEMYAAASSIPTDILLEVLRDRYRTLEDKMTEILEVAAGFSGDFRKEDI